MSNYKAGKSNESSHRGGLFKRRSLRKKLKSEVGDKVYDENNEQLSVRRERNQSERDLNIRTAKDSRAGFFKRRSDIFDAKSKYREERRDITQVEEDQARLPQHLRNQSEQELLDSRMKHTMGPKDYRDLARRMDTMRAEASSDSDIDRGPKSDLPWEVRINKYKLGE